MAPADQDAGEADEAVEDVHMSLPAHGEPAELVEQGEGLFANVLELAQAFAAGGLRHREDLVAERPWAINRLRWHLHDLDAQGSPASRSLDRVSNLARVLEQLAGLSGAVAQLATMITGRCRSLSPTRGINMVEAEIRGLPEQLAPALLALPGCGTLTAVKILGETAGFTRFRSAAAYARHNGSAPLPVWSSTASRTDSAAPATDTSTPPCTASP